MTRKVEAEQPTAHPLDTPGFSVSQRSIVDRDELPPRQPPSQSADQGAESGQPPFSNSLITNTEED